MADKVQLEVVTPTRILLSEEADMVVAPGGDGDFGILPGHAPLLSTLRPGTMDIYVGGKVSHTLFVAGGFAEVTGDRFTLLAEEAVPVAEIDAAEAEERLRRAREAEEKAEDADLDVAEYERRVAEAMVAAAEPGPKGRA